MKAARRGMFHLFISQFSFVVALLILLGSSSLQKTCHKGIYLETSVSSCSRRCRPHYCCRGSALSLLTPHPPLLWSPLLGKMQPSSLMGTAPLSSVPGAKRTPGLQGRPISVPD